MNRTILILTVACCILASAAALVSSAQRAANLASEPTDGFSEWIYPESGMLMYGATSDNPPHSETGQYFTPDPIKKVAAFYAERAGLEDSELLEFEFPSKRPAREGASTAVRRNPEQRSALFLRDIREDVASLTFLCWGGRSSGYVAVSLTRGADEKVTHIHLLLSRQTAD